MVTGNNNDSRVKTGFKAFSQKSTGKVKFMKNEEKLCEGRGRGGGDENFEDGGAKEGG